MNLIKRSVLKIFVRSRPRSATPASSSSCVKMNSSALTYSSTVDAKKPTGLASASLTTAYCPSVVG